MDRLCLRLSMRKQYSYIAAISITICFAVNTQIGALIFVLLIMLRIISMKLFAL
jgi:hypothetical protein